MAVIETIVIDAPVLGPHLRFDRIVADEGKTVVVYPHISIAGDTGLFPCAFNAPLADIHTDGVEGVANLAVPDHDLTLNIERAQHGPIEKAGIKLLRLAFDLGPGMATVPHIVVRILHPGHPVQHQTLSGMLVRLSGVQEIPPTRAIASFDRDVPARSDVDGVRPAIFEAQVFQHDMIGAKKLEKGEIPIQRLQTAMPPVIARAPAIQNRAAPAGPRIVIGLSVVPETAMSTGSG